MIVLPLHGQNTAALNIFNWAGNACNTRNARGSVFGQQTGFMLAEFLLCLKIFLGTCCVELTLDLIVNY